jgi:hypothetical protein
MADPVTGALVMQGIAGGAKAAGALGQARAERRAAEGNAYIAETRALQTGTAGAATLRDELASLRATMAANGQQAGPEFWQQITRLRSRETRIGVNNERQIASDYRTQGRNAMARGRVEAIGGLSQAARAGFSIWDDRTRG